MAVTVFIYPALNLLHSRYSDVVTRDDLRANIDAIQRHPHFRPGLNRLVDLTAVSAFDYNVGEAVTLSEEARRHYQREQRLKCAYLAPTRLAFGMARMFEGLLSDHENLQIGVFRDAQDVRRFLGLHDPIPSLDPET